MPAQTLHFNLPDAERPSIWPWLVALVAGVCLIVVVVQKAQSIPRSLQQQAVQIISKPEYENISVRISGRDLELVGTIDKQKNTTQLIQQLGDIEGIRVVRDKLKRINAEELKFQQTQEFLEALSRVDVSSVSFLPGSNSFTSESNAALNQLAQLLIDNPNRRIRIEGHTDNTGPSTVNMRLSNDRAEAVARFLLKSRKISAKQLIVKGYGSLQPIASNDTESGRARNRRIEISYVD